MSSKKVVLLIIALGLFNALNAQKINFKKSKSKKEKSLFEKSILPLSLIIGGSAMSGSYFEKDLQKHINDMMPDNYYTEIADYTRFVPIVEMYAADIIGVEAKNHWFDQTKYLTMSMIITDFITTKLKRTTKKIRPSGSDDTSFPSGHTSSSFAGASVLYHEFSDSNSLLAYSGYAFATTTGTFRMLTNDHYLSDVLVGAGIAILVTELIYHFEPLKNFNPFKKIEKNIAVFPYISNDALGQSSYGIYFRLGF